MWKAILAALWGLFTAWSQQKQAAETQARHRAGAVLAQVEQKKEAAHAAVAEATDPDATVDEQLRDLGLLK
jgi:hypothetical protein